MSPVDRTEIEQRLVAARALLVSLPRGSVAHRDAQSAVRHLERLALVNVDLPPTVDPAGIRRRR